MKRALLASGCVLAALALSAQVAINPSRIPWQLPLGGGGALARPCGVLTTNTTQTGTTAVTTEEDLWTYTLPANSLNADGRGVRLSSVVQTAANANTKNVRWYFGGTVLNLLNTTLSGATIIFQSVILRTGASAQLAWSNGWRSDASMSGVVPSLTTPAADTTGTIVVRITGQNGTASANDVLFRGVVLECF